MGIFGLLVFLLTACDTSNTTSTQHGANGTPTSSIGSITNFALPMLDSVRVPSGITAGPDGNIWFIHGGWTERIISEK